MKIGFRKPSIKKRISARTSPKRMVRHNLGVKAPRGFGWFTNPKKAAYNRIYNRTSVGCVTLMLPLILLIFLVFAAAASGQTAVVIAQNASLRGTPSTTGKVVDTIPRNQAVDIMIQKGPWYLVQTTDFAGWLHGNTIRITSGTVVQYEAPPPPTQLYNLPPPTQSAPTRQYIRGPRGGCYYINRNGNRTYVDRSLCN